MNPLTAVVIGAGDRGTFAYAPYALDYPHELKITAVAEPIPTRRRRFKEKFDLPEDACYETWEDFPTDRKLADVAIICTMDKQHFEPAMKALELGYHVLLEKPMSPSAKECVELERQAKRYNRQLSICHVLRYTNFWSKIREVIKSGTIGEVASVQLNENVEIMHMSHSFVRGNWSNKEKSSPMILQKSCHDLDIINFILDKKCERLSSYGSLMYFNEDNKPEGAPKRCLDGCPVANECPFHAGNYYLGSGRGWAAKFAKDTSREAIIEGLNETDYGRCVFQSDNNVVDHQVVNMEFEGGTTASFSMSGFTREQTRITQIMGTKGEIRGNMSDNSISIFDYLTKHETVINFDNPVGGHGGGDKGIVSSFLEEIKSGGLEESISSASASMRSHLMALAAEDSRLNKGQSIEIDEYYTSLVNS